MAAKRKKFKSKFTMLVEQAVERYQQGGIINGDYVKFVKNITSSEFYKTQTSSMKQKIDEMVAADLHLRVSAIKSAMYAQQPVDGGLNAAGQFYADVITEYAPGLYRDPITVPLQVIELVDSGVDGFGKLRAPESQVYDNKEHGLEEIKVNDPNRTLPVKNTTLQYMQ